MVLETSGNSAPWDGRLERQIEEKSNQMLGAAIYSTGQDGVIAVSDWRTLNVYCPSLTLTFTCTVHVFSGLCSELRIFHVRAEPKGACRKLLRLEPVQHNIHRSFAVSQTWVGSIGPIHYRKLPLFMFHQKSNIFFLNHLSRLMWSVESKTSTLCDLARSKLAWPQHVQSVIAYSQLQAAAFIINLYICDWQISSDISVLKEVKDSLSW